jgi:hypothetical protein
MIVSCGKTRLECRPIAPLKRCNPARSHGLGQLSRAVRRPVVSHDDLHWRELDHGTDRLVAWSAAATHCARDLALTLFHMQEPCSHRPILA